MIELVFFMFVDISICLSIEFSAMVIRKVFPSIRSLYDAISDVIYDAISDAISVAICDMTYM